MGGGSLSFSTVTTEECVFSLTWEARADSIEDIGVLIGGRLLRLASISAAEVVLLRPLLPLGLGCSAVFTLESCPLVSLPSPGATTATVSAVTLSAIGTEATIVPVPGLWALIGVATAPLTS